MSLSGGNSYYLLGTAGVGATRKIGNPTNGVAGTAFVFRFQQSSGGGQTVTWDTQWDLGGQTFSPTGTANKVQEFYCYCVDSTHFIVRYMNTAEYAS